MIYETGKINTPAGAAQGPIIMIFTARMFEIKRQAANRIPANMKLVETVVFIDLVFYVVTKYTIPTAGFRFGKGTNYFFPAPIFSNEVIKPWISDELKP